MSDPGKYRTREEIQETRENRDPIERIRALLLQMKYFNEDEIKALDKEVRDKVSEAAELAKDEAYPSDSELYKDIYKE